MRYYSKNSEITTAYKKIYHRGIRKRIVAEISQKLDVKKSTAMQYLQTGMPEQYEGLVLKIIKAGYKKQEKLVNSKINV